MPVLAVDVGGTKLEAGLVDADGSITGRRRAATTGSDGDALFEQLMGIVEPLMADGPVTAACWAGRLEMPVTWVMWS